jgi:hypothetical protein
MMPEGREYKSHRLLRYEKGKPETGEVFKFATEYLEKDYAILAFKLLGLENHPSPAARSGRHSLDGAGSRLLQRLPALALFPPVRYPRQWLKLTQVNRITAALRPR